METRGGLVIVPEKKENANSTHKAHFRENKCAS